VDVVGRLSARRNSVDLRGIGNPVEPGHRHLRTAGVVDAGKDDAWGLADTEGNRDFPVSFW
jgi:hypothetical protein